MRASALCLIVLGAGSCFSADDVAPPATVMQLERSGIEPIGLLHVDETGDWYLISQTTCSVAKGTLSLPVLGTLRGFVADSRLKSLPVICPDGTWLKLTDSTFHVVACWNPKQSDLPEPAKAIGTMFDNTAAMLSWDGKHKVCEQPKN